jgi:hypothetical protein
MSKSSRERYGLWGKTERARVVLPDCRGPVIATIGKLRARRLTVVVVERLIMKQFSLQLHTLANEITICAGIVIFGGPGTQKRSTGLQIIGYSKIGALFTS